MSVVATNVCYALIVVRDYDIRPLSAVVGPEIMNLNLTSERGKRSALCSITNTYICLCPACKENASNAFSERDGKGVASTTDKSVALF